MEKLNNGNLEETSQDKGVTSTYEYAMEKLSSLITRKKRDGTSAVSEFEKRERMLRYIEILDLEKQTAGLKIIHVAGTKGKGSTCAFCEAILRECGFITGLFTSPHLIDVRERFRLDGLDISEEKFLQHFWECWNQLKDNIMEGLPMPLLFQFFTLLAFKIFAYEKVDVAIIEAGIGGTFDSTNVIKDPVVCGITSLGMDHIEILGDTLGKIASQKAGILKPQVPAFTVPQPSEAMEVLYDRAHKLMVPLKVVTRLDSKVLKDVKLSLSGDHQFTNAALAISLCKSWLKTTGLQKLENADSEETLPDKFLTGLSSARLSGRAQIVHDDTTKNSSEISESYPGGLTFYLDGAHSPESMEACARWFSTVVGENKNSSLSSSCLKTQTPKRTGIDGCIPHGDTQESYKMSNQILLFNCMDVRDPQILLSRLVNTCASSGTHFSKAIFVPSMSAYDKVTSGTSSIPSNIPQKDLSWQLNLQRVWERIRCGKDFNALDHNLNMTTSGNVPPCQFLFEDAPSCSQGDGNIVGSAVFPSLPSAINWLRNCVKENPSSRIQVLVTGSLHLVGDVLRLLRR